LRKQFPGATHASDIPFAFDTVLTKYGKDLTEQDAAAARAMHAYWVAFAKTGKPGVAGQPEWPTYNPQRDILMDFTNSGPVVGPDPWRARLDVAERSNEAHAAVPR
jgi:para-nitrobenzyl esterase